MCVCVCVCVGSAHCVQSKNTNTHSATAILLVASCGSGYDCIADIEDKLQENVGSPANSSQSRTDAATSRQKTDLMNVPCVGRVLSLGVCCLAQTGIRSFYSCSSHSLRAFSVFTFRVFCSEFIALTHCQWCCCCCCCRSAHIFVRRLERMPPLPRLPHAVNSGS